MAVNLSPVGGVAAQFFDNAGNVLTGGKLHTYLAGTTTPQPAYTTSAGTIAWSNPIILDAAGRVSGSGEIWLTDGVQYKFILRDSNDVLIATYDNINGINSNFIAFTGEEETQTATQGQTVFTLTTMQYQPGVNNLLVFVNGSKQVVGVNFVETSSTVVTFVSGLNVDDVVNFCTAVPINTNVVGACQVAYDPPFTGSVSIAVCDKLAQTISIKDFGAVCDGIVDDTAAVQAAISAVVGDSVSLIIPGPTLVNANLTFAPTTQLQFQNGGKFIGTAGTEIITLQRAPVANIQQIFDNCDPYSTTGMTICPEWFGAVKDGTTDDRSAFQSALRFLRDVGGIIQLQAGFYAVSDRISIDYNNITIQGAGNNTSWIKVTGSNKNGVVVNGVAGTPIRNVMLRDFSVILNTIATASTVGIFLNYTVFAIVERIQIHDFLIGLGMEGATNSQITKVGATYTGGATNGFIGFNIYGGASGAAAANASSILRDCYVSGTPGLTGQIGFRLFGSYMSDVQLDTCETALTNYGYFVDYSTAPNFNVDIIIRNPIVDRFYLQGILINALPSNGILQIIGGYTNPDTLGAAAENIYLDTCLGAINIIGHEFMALSNTIFTDGLYADSCSGVTISGCLFSMLDKGVYMDSCSFCVIANNIFRGGNPSAFSKMVEVISGARVMVNGNSFDGATEGVIIDATSSGCGIVGNTANIATVGTRYSNLGTGPIGGADGSTGLNSGI
jgi:parallel beta-helix repeat protein